MSDLTARLAEALTGRYRLDRPVGRGGMSVVYAAEDLRHERRVAIKLFTEAVGSGGSERFLREIGFLARLHHPHILPLLDSGASEGLLYYVMPLVDGESLRDRMTREPRMAMGDALRLLVEVCDALRYAHAQGIVHRDIKPENILLVDRHAVVADFGVARAVHRDTPGSSNTTAGLAIGTPTYMSPEQAAADPQIDHRADIYALGIVAYEMLAGHPPFTEDAPHIVLAAHVTQAPRDLAELRPDLPTPLTDVIMQCLAKRPEHRFADAGALREALEPFVLPSGAVTPAAMPPYLRRRRRLQLVGAALGLVLLTALAVRLLPTNTAALQLGDPARLGVATELELDATVSRDGRFLAQTVGRLGQMRIQVRQMSGGEAITVAPGVDGNQRWPRWAPDGSRLAFQAGGTVYTVPALGGPVSTMVEGAPDAPAGDFSWSPDGTQVAYTQAGALLVRPANGGPTRTLTTDINAHSLAWSPDGRWLAYVSGNAEFVFSDILLGNIAPSRLHLIALDGDTPRPLTDGRSLATSPVWIDNRTLVFVGGGGATRDLFTVRVSGRGRPTGAPARLTTGLRVHTVGLSADRQHLIYVQLDHSANILRVDRPLPGGPPASISDGAWVTDGDQVVEDMDVFPIGGMLLFDSNRDGNQDIFLQTGPNALPMALTRDPADEFGPVWSPTGREVAYYSVRDGIRHVFVMRATGQDVVQVTSDSLQDQQPQWSPDGNSLVFARRDGAGRDRIFTVTRTNDTTWDAPRLVTEEWATAPSWSSDGRWIAFTDPAGNLRVVDVEGGGSRIVAEPVEVGGLPIRRPYWLFGELAMLARVEGPAGSGGIWRFSLYGEPPEELVRFDEPTLPVYRTEVVADARSIYVVVSDFRSSAWRIPVTTPSQ